MDLKNLNKDRKDRRKKGSDLSTMMYGKVPPQAKDLEEAILGAMLLDSSCLTFAISKLFSEVFYVEAHQYIFQSILNVYDRNQPIDLLTVIEDLKRVEKLDYAGGPYYVTKITNSVVSGANIEAHILIISEMYLKRETIKICGEAIGEAYEDSTDAFEVISNTDLEMQRMQERILSNMTRDIGYFGMKMLEQHEQVKRTGVLGINTGITALDRVICGLVAPDLIIIAARPGQGKTALALSMTHLISIQRHIPCAWFSLEMDGVQLIRRLASIDTGIDHGRIRNGQTSHEEDIILGNSINKISECKIFIEDKTSITGRDIRTRTALLKKKNPDLGFIVVDYLQLMSGNGDNKNREQVVSELSRQLKQTAREVGIPVIALSQLSRAVEARNDKMPQLSDLRESGAIEQDADEVIFLMRPEYYKMTDHVEIDGTDYHPAGLAIANVAKNRHGATRHIPIRFNGPTMKFSDHSPNHF